jgi:AcrR family transcriptional regulator
VSFKLDRSRIGREQLELALIDEVVERGFPGASIEGVCARCSAERADFLHHFTDLEDGYCQIFEVMRNMALEKLLPAFASQSSWRDQIRAVAYALFDFVDEDRLRARYMFVEGYSAGERAQLLRDEGSEILIELIDQGRDELADPSLVTRATAEAIGGTIVQKIRIAVEQNVEDASDLLPQLMYSVVAPYVGADEARAELTIGRTSTSRPS